MNNTPPQKNQLQCSEYQKELQMKIEDTTCTGNSARLVTITFRPIGPYSFRLAGKMSCRLLPSSLETNSTIPCNW